jgi:hypothetical protein|tara:strand:- start:18658 stop:19578 length:921 start_codon:yes stop_codon:yes gene_type:complete
MQATMEQPQITKPRTGNEIHNTKMVPHTSSYQINKDGGKKETRFKVTMVLVDTEIPVYVTLPPMETKFTEFSENGDAETFGKNPDDGKQSASLVAKVPDKIARVMPSLKTDQQDAVAQLKDWHMKMVLHAFHTLPKKGPGSCSFASKARSKAKKENVKDIEARAAEIYLENAHCGGVSERDTEENGETVTEEIVTLKRKVTGYEKGIKGRYPPIFHKIDIEGNYHDISHTVDKYLPRGTLVQCRTRPQFFSAPTMYGTTLALDRDIIVMWKPKRKGNGMEPKKVQYFADGDSDDDTEPPAKRSRVE